MMERDSLDLENELKFGDLEFSDKELAEMVSMRKAFLAAKAAKAAKAAPPGVGQPGRPGDAGVKLSRRLNFTSTTPRAEEPNAQSLLDGANALGKRWQDQLGDDFPNAEQIN